MLELGAKLLRVAKNIKKGVPRRTKLVMALVQVAGGMRQAAALILIVIPRSEAVRNPLLLGTRY